MYRSSQYDSRVYSSSIDPFAQQSTYRIGTLVQPPAPKLTWLGRLVARVTRVLNLH